MKPDKLEGEVKAAFGLQSMMLALICICGLIGGAIAKIILVFVAWFSVLLMVFWWPDDWWPNTMFARWRAPRHKAGHDQN